MINTIFWIAFLFIFYPYVGYPFLLWFQKKFKQQKVNKSKNNNLPKVTIIMAVKNGENVLGSRLNNFLNLDYQKDKLQIIAVSDGSTDCTNKILNEFAAKYSEIIKCVIYSPSHGKPFAINKGVNLASGDIILFADCRQLFEPEVVKEIVANFHDENVGCVSGELRFQEDFESKIKVEMGAYWKFEKWLRSLESSTGSVVGATGAVYAIRKELYNFLPVQTLLDDVLIPMNIALHGYRVIFESNAVAYDIFSKDLSQERKRKLRTLAGNWQLINLAPDLFKAWKNPIWFRFISHKICRLFVPLFLLILLVSSLLGRSIFYQFVAWFQICFYLIAFMGWMVPCLQKNRLVNLSYFFLTMNIVTAGGFFIWCFGRCKNVWKDHSSNKRVLNNKNTKK